MNRPDEMDMTAEWIAMRMDGGDQFTDADSLLDEFERVEDCVQLLDQIGGRSTPPPPYEADTTVREMLPHLDVGRFEILHFVGRGGMGNVFLAKDPVLERKVAIKIPRLDLRGEPKLKQRFLREARAMGGLSHPNLVQILEIGEDGPMMFLVLEWCDGPNLGDWLERQHQPLAPGLVAKLVAVLAETLAHCHAQGVVHRDLKPSNILLDISSNDLARREKAFSFVPKITDFGLARLLEESLEQTDSSLLLGTPSYMAPEQADCRHKDVGPQTDVYALGVILYQLLTGRMPFQETAAVRVLDQIRHEQPASLSRLRPDLPKHLRVICEKCMQKRIEDRYQTAVELAADLRRFEQGEPIRGRPIPFLTKFERWLQKPERLGNAALATIVVNAIFIVWMIFSAIGDTQGVGLPIDESIPFALGRVAVIATLVHVVPIGLAVFIMRQRRWALLAATVMAGVLWLWVTAIVFGMNAPFPGYEERPILKGRVFWMLEAIALVQLVSLLLAQRAATQNRDRR